MSGQLKEYVGKIVAITDGINTRFSQLQTDGTIFGFPPHLGFPEEAVKELRVIEVPPEQNQARAVIVL